MSFNEKTISLPSGETTCRVGGEGPPVLAIHSAGGFRHSRALDVLARQFNIHALILPGFDGTAQIDGIASMPALADLAAEYIDAEMGGGPCDVMGHSFGGWLSLWLAVRHPDKVGQLVLQAPAGFRVGGAGGLGGTPEELRRRMFAHPENLPPEDKPAEVSARNRELAGEYGKGVAVDEDLLARLGDVGALTLILHGTEDGVIPVESARLLKERIPHCFLNYIYDAAHNIEVDQPDHFVELVSDFLTRGEGYLVNAGTRAGAV